MIFNQYIAYNSKKYILGYSKYQGIYSTDKSWQLYLIDVLNF